MINAQEHSGDRDSLKYELDSQWKTIAAAARKNGQGVSLDKMEKRLEKT